MFGDDVEQITVLSGRGIHPFSDSTFARFRSEEPDIHGVPWRIHDVANDPIPAGASAVGKIVAANGFDILGESPREIMCAVAHGKAFHGKRGPRSPASPSQAVIGENAYSAAIASATSAEW